MIARVVRWLLVLLPLAASGLERQYAFRTLNVNDGLTHNTVLAILQDRTGFMWFGTKDGLNRYDGTEIRVVPVDDAIPGNNYVTSLCEDCSGRIWIGTDAGVCMYDPQTEHARRFLMRSDDGSRISGGISRIVLAPDSTIWICGGSRGFFRYDPSREQLTHIAGDQTGRRRYTARNICFTNRGAACLALDDGNLYLSDDGLQSVSPVFAEGGAEAFRDVFVNRLVPGAFNRIYVCSSRGLFEVDLAVRSFRRIGLPSSNGYVRDLQVAGPNEIWVATESCLEIFDGNMQPAASLRADQDLNNSLQSNYCLHKDREGGMWVGTYFAGVSYSRAGNSTAVRRYFAVPDTRRLGRYIREIVPDADGDLWIGTESRGLFRYRPQSDTLESIRVGELYDGRRNLFSNVHGLCCDGDYIWAGTYEQGHTLVRIDRHTLAGPPAGTCGSARPPG